MMPEQYRFSAQITGEFFPAAALKVCRGGLQRHGTACVHGRRHIWYTDHPDFRRIPTFAEAVSAEVPPTDYKMGANR